jgi:hypothetical protein
MQKNNLKFQEILLCLVLNLTIFTVNSKLVGLKPVYLTK